MIGNKSNTLEVALLIQVNLDRETLCRLFRSSTTPPNIRPVVEAVYINAQNVTFATKKPNPSKSNEDILSRRQSSCSLEMAYTEASSGITSQGPINHEASQRHASLRS